MLTYVSFELALEELEGDYGGGEKGYVGSCYTPPGKAEVPVQLAHVVRTSWPSKAFFGVFTSLVCLVQGKAIEQRRVLIVWAHLDELSLPIFIRLLEDREDRPPNDSVQAHPWAISRILGLEQEKEDIYRGR